jgi:hypothetical protein
MIENLNKALDYIEKGIRLLSAEKLSTAKLDAVIARLVEVRMLRDRAKGMTGQVNFLHERLRQEVVPAAMERAGLTTAGHRLGRVVLATRTSASIIPDHRPQAYTWLRTHGLGGLIIETVNAQSLSGAARELIEAGKELPDDFFKTSIHTYASLALRGRANKEDD